MSGIGELVPAEPEVGELVPDAGRHGGIGAQEVNELERVRSSS